MKKYKVRKTLTKSGSTAVQVVCYRNRKLEFVRQIGSGKTEEEIVTLVKRAEYWIESNEPQQELFIPPKQVEVKNLEVIGVYQSTSYKTLLDTARRCGLSSKKEKFLIDFAIIRIIEPASKLRSITLLSQYFGIEYSERTVYRKIKELHLLKKSIEQKALECAKEQLDQDLSLILYDVTTLYFETFKSDELRVPGFSKDNKHQQPQIVVGLIVTRSGFPLSYEVFSGNTFEGKTMLEVLKNFIKINSVARPVVVADAAMLSHQNIQELVKEGYSYIVGARLGNMTWKMIDKISSKIKPTDGKIIREKTKEGDLIVQFSQKRYNKDKHEFEKQLERAKESIEKSASAKNVKFVKPKNKNNEYILNNELIEKARKLLGLKGYYTNIQKSELSNPEIIERYHDLWQIEKSFRITKSDLATRPVFHHNSRSVKSHILICFTALMMSKYLELATGYSIRRITDAIKEIKEVVMQDSVTGLTISKFSRPHHNTEPIMELLKGKVSY